MPRATATALPQDQDVLAGIFGPTPQKGEIFLASKPLPVRFNCKDGQFKIGPTEPLGAEASIVILKTSSYFGDLGLTAECEWFQIFYVVAPGCKARIPQGVVCVSYLKKESLTNFSTLVTKLIAEGKQPAKGIFKVRFSARAGKKGQYYAAEWEWQERVAKEEVEQLPQIVQFMQNRPSFIDMDATRGMICIDGKAPEEVALLVAEQKQQKLLLAAAASKDS